MELSKNGMMRSVMIEISMEPLFLFVILFVNGKQILVIMGVEMNEKVVKRENVLKI